MIPHPLPAKPKPAITNSKQKSSGTIASFLPAKPPGILSQSRSAKTKTSGVHIAIPQTADIQTVFIQQKSAKTPISQVRITAIESSNTLNPSPAAPANNATASSFFKRDPFPPPSPDTFPKPVNHESRPLSMQHFPKIVAPDGTVAVLSVSDDPTYIHGPFSIREQQAVKAAVYKFLDTYGMVDSDLHDLLHVKTRSARWPNINRTFWAEVLANSGVNRSVNQVYKHVKSILSNDNRRDSDKYLLARRDYTRWTHEEDVKLLDAVAFYGSEGFWKKIELELGRVGVRERYRLLQNSNDSSKSHGTWTVAEEAALLSTMLEHHKPKTADEKPEASTWLQVMNAIPTRSLISIRLKWKVQIWLTWKAAIERQATTSELSEPKSIEWKYGSDDFNLLKSLKKNFKGAFDASDIRWSQIPGFEAWDRKKLVAAWNRFEKQIPKNILEKKPRFNSRVKYLVKNFNILRVDKRTHQTNFGTKFGQSKSSEYVDSNEEQEGDLEKEEKDEEEEEEEREAKERQKDFGHSIIEVKKRKLFADCGNNDSRHNSKKKGGKER